MSDDDRDADLLPDDDPDVVEGMERLKQLRNEETRITEIRPDRR